MLFTKGLIKPFILNLRLFNFIGSYLYEIDHVTYMLTFNSSKKLQNELLLKWSVIALILATLSAQLIAFRGIFEKAQIYEGFFYISFVYLTVGIHILYFRRSTLVLELFNSLVHMERQLITRNLLESYSPKRGYTLFIKGFQMCAIYSPVFLPCFGLHIWLQPCVPFAPGFWILDECRQYVTNPWITLSGTISSICWTFPCLLIVWVERVLVENHGMVLGQFFFMVAFCLRYYLNNLLVQVKIGCTKTSVLEKISIYKSLQLMIRLFNGLNQDIYLLLILNLLGMSVVVGLFALITLTDALSIPQYILMGTGAVQASLAITIGFGIFGGIYSDSIQTLQAFRTGSPNLKTRNERKICRKVVASLGPLKVMMGSVNYVDKLTPASLFDFFIGILVNLLLLK